jgi:two-component system, OmpR family, sensor histidine kinase ChvG
VKFRIPFGIRGQVFLVSLVLFAIPWVGYRYVLEVENFLRQGQERTLTGTAQAVATALHDRPQLFEPVAAIAREGNGLLYARTLARPIVLDGQMADWRAQDVKKAQYQDDRERGFSFSQQAGKFDQFLYLMFDVKDSGVETMNNQDTLYDQADQLELSFGRDSVEPVRVRIVLARAPQVKTLRIESTDDNERYTADASMGNWVSM